MVHASACTIEIWSTREVWRARKKRKSCPRRYPRATLARKIVFVLGPVGSLRLYQLLSRNIIFSPSLTTAARAKKEKFWRICLLTQSASTIGILSTLTYTEFDRTSARYVIKKIGNHNVCNSGDRQTNC